MKRSVAPARGPLEREARAVLRDAGESLKRLESRCSRAVAAAAEAAISSLGSGGTVYFCGNGGNRAGATRLEPFERFAGVTQHGARLALQGTAGRRD